MLTAARLRGSVALVPTMGALHEGHRALLCLARDHAATVVASIFVNPTQFAADEDLARYPRTLDADLDLCADGGVDVVFAPPDREVYPSGPPTVTVDPGPLGTQLEGAARPTHFRGVLTVVAKLFGLVRPDVAVFGEKDYQQLLLVRQMVRDLAIGVRVVAGATVREADGLALSSRNRYLSPAERVRARVLSQALYAGAAAGPAGADAVLAAASAVLEAGAVDLDYLELRAPDLSPAPTSGPARLLVAARVGSTRLIDNVPVTLTGVPESGKE
ncbi:MAG: pantoate--beta-alanine ligase [Actinomycetota bacterium]|nr:pantoate--beta-alanine ligase [Actinomycetota bacterium]